MPGFFLLARLRVLTMVLARRRSSLRSRSLSSDRARPAASDEWSEARAVDASAWRRATISALNAKPISSSRNRCTRWDFRIVTASVAGAPASADGGGLVGEIFGADAGDLGGLGGVPTKAAFGEA
jgi:hypothetical protein